MIIYARAVWNKWSGGRVFNMRGEGEGDCGAGVVFRNIRVEDGRPTLQPFLIAMQVCRALRQTGQSPRRGSFIRCAISEH